MIILFVITSFKGYTALISLRYLSIYPSIYLSIYVYITIFIAGTTITKTLMFQGSRTKLFEKGKKPKVQKTAIFVLYRKYLAPFIFLL